MNSEIQTKLEQLAIKRSHPFCYNCYSRAPSGVCSKCGSDDLMRELPQVGVEYGIDWIIKSILESELNPINEGEAFEECMREVYPDTTQVGFLILDTVSTMQDLGILVDLRNNAGNREHVFPRLQSWAEGQQANILRRFCIGIGLRSIRFHALRACFATQLLSNDVAPAKVMKVCGWQDLKTMQHYVRLAGVDERGVTDSLNLIPSDEECMDKVVRILDFKNGKN